MRGRTGCANFVGGSAGAGRSAADCRPDGARAQAFIALGNRVWKSRTADPVGRQLDPRHRPAAELCQPGRSHLSTHVALDREGVLGDDVVEDLDRDVPADKQDVDGNVTPSIVTATVERSVSALIFGAWGCVPKYIAEPSQWKQIGITRGDPSVQVYASRAGFVEANIRCATGSSSNSTPCPIAASPDAAPRRAITESTQCAYGPPDAETPNIPPRTGTGTQIIDERAGRGPSRRLLSVPAVGALEAPGAAGAAVACSSCTATPQMIWVAGLSASPRRRSPSCCRAGTAGARTPRSSRSVAWTFHVALVHDDPVEAGELVGSRSRTCSSGSAGRSPRVGGPRLVARALDPGARASSRRRPPWPWPSPAAFLVSARLLGLIARCCLVIASSAARWAAARPGRRPARARRSGSPLSRRR